MWMCGASALAWQMTRLRAPSYLEAMRLRLRSGRVFTPLDRAEGPPVLVLSETLAREIFGGEPAVGRRVVPAGAGDEPWEVVGFVADVRYPTAR